MKRNLRDDKYYYSIRFLDRESVECFYSFRKNNKYLEYLSVEFLRVLIVKKRIKICFLQQESLEMDLFTSFEAMQLF